MRQIPFQPAARLTPLALPAVLALLAFGAGCGGDPAPVAGVEVTPKTVRLGFPEVRDLSLSWSPSVALPEGGGEGGPGQPTVFVHLLDERDEVVRTFDHPFPQRWQAGVPVRYDLKLYQSALGPPLPAGRYRLTLGLYQTGQPGEDAERFALDGLGEAVDRREYQIAEVEVPEQGPNDPRIAFSSDSWLEVEPGGDRQILGRRWMGPGPAPPALRFQGIAAPGTVWMLIRIPEGKAAGERLELTGGSNTPSVLVSGTCGSVETNLTGPGDHEVERPVEELPQGGSCDVVLKPSFRLLVAGSRDRSASLENIAWAPGAPGASGTAAPAGADPGQGPGTTVTEPAPPEEP